MQYAYDANNYGFLRKVMNRADNTQVYWEATARNDQGQVTTALLGNNATLTRYINETTGRLMGDTVVNNAAPSSVVYGNAYAFDALGNLTSRITAANSALAAFTSAITAQTLPTGALKETYTYDDLSRLKAVTPDASMTGCAAKGYDYDALGNLTTKSDNGGAYTYGGARPHAVTSAGGVSYTYDANGNIATDSSGRAFSFNDFNRPVNITKGSIAANFVYDEAEKLLGQTLNQPGKSTTTVYIGGLFERISTTEGSATTTECKHYIMAEGGAVAVHTITSDATANTRYLYKDHLGSIGAIADGTLDGPWTLGSDLNSTLI